MVNPASLHQLISGSLLPSASRANPASVISVIKVAALGKLGVMADPSSQKSTAVAGSVEVGQAQAVTVTTTSAVTSGQPSAAGMV